MLKRHFSVSLSFENMARTRRGENIEKMADFRAKSGGKSGMQKLRAVNNPKLRKVQFTTKDGVAVSFVETGKWKVARARKKYEYHLNYKCQKRFPGAPLEKVAASAPQKRRPVRARRTVQRYGFN